MDNLDPTQRLLVTLVEQQDVMIKYLADIRNILVLMARKEGLTIESSRPVEIAYIPIQNTEDIA